MKRLLLSVVGVVLSAALIAGVGFSSVIGYKSLKKIDELQDKFTAMEEEEKSKETQGSQYVVIGSQYEIIDTSAISDAYISGDDSKLTDDKDKETLKIASDLLAKITKGKKSNYEKELAIHDWMAENIKFDDSSLAAIPGSTEFVYKPYGVLKYKNAVCVGYATTFKLLMNMLGMDCMVVHDKDLSHSWDLVELEKDQWYYVDVTFDADSTGAKHLNFNVTKDVFANTHDFYADGLPLANSTEYNYAVQNAVSENDLMKVPKLIKNTIDKKKNEIYINFGQLSTDKVQEVSDVMTTISDRISSNSGTVYSEISSASAANGDIIFGLVFTKTDAGAGDVPATDNEELNQLITQLFGESYTEGME